MSTRYGKRCDKHKKQIVSRNFASLRSLRRSANGLGVALVVAWGICLGLLTVSSIPCHAASSEGATQVSHLSRPVSTPESAASPKTVNAQPEVKPHPRRANFEKEPRSRDAQQMADWVVDSGDNQSMPFVVVDKKDARVFVFGADGQLRGAAPALLGLARKDECAPGIGDRELSSIGPEERTTPAGRFVAALGFNYSGKDVLWVDYDLAVSLHRVVTSNPKEHRLERLATPTPLDNRISFGCINVPAAFFDSVVIPTLTGTYGVVYILPEIRPTREIFARYYDVD